MRIISRFKDYYDSAQAYGSDHTKAYLREARAIEYSRRDAVPVQWTPFLSSSHFSGPYQCGDGMLRLEVTLVLFCGKLYKGMRVRRHPRDVATEGLAERASFDLSDPSAVEDVTFYDAIGALEYLERHLGSDRVRQKHWLQGRSLQGTVEDHLAHQGTTELLQWSISEKIAIAVMQFRSSLQSGTFFRLTLNPALRTVQFYRVLEAWEAYQELDMFWGGVLAPEARPSAKIADKYRIAQHGFNKYSFRRTPSKKA